MKKIILLSLGFILIINLSNAQVVLNEVMYDPAGADGGFLPGTPPVATAGAYGEWIELYGPAGADISCYVITDGDWTITIPSGTTIPAGQLFVIGAASWANTPDPTSGSVAVDLDTETCGCTTGTGTNLPPGLTNGGEYIMLFDDMANYLDGVVYEFPLTSGTNSPAGVMMNTSAVGACAATTVNVGANAGSMTQLPSPGLGGGFSRDEDGAGTWTYITQAGATPGTANNPFGPLPVELISFEANQIDNQVVELKWATASEEDNDYFAIQHSSDNIDFRTIDEVKGAGTSDVVNTYKFIHENLSAGDHYYRLKQVDLDGTFEYSNIKMVEVRGKELKISIFPNPVVADLTVQFSSPLKEDMDYQLLSFSGQLVLENTLQEDNNSLVIDMNDYPQGVYFLKMQTRNESFVRKVVRR